MSASSQSTQLKAGLAKSSSCSAGMLRYSAVQIAHPALHAGVQRVLQQVPVEALVVVPLALLAELAAHEQQLLARVRPHVAVQQPQVGELLPLVARHLADERALAVHHLVVRERQHEVLGEGVDQAEGEAAVVVLAVHRVVLEVLERVVHPAHVPLEPEAQAAEVGGPRNHRPGGRFLGDGLGVGVVAVHCALNCLRNSIASRFSRPPKRLGIHSPALRA